MESAGRSAHTSAIASIPSVSARCRTRSATALSPESWAPRTRSRAARSAASASRVGSSSDSMPSKNLSPGVSGRWWGRLVTRPRYRPRSAREQLPDALVADRTVGAELLGEQGHPVLLEHPARSAERIARRTAVLEGCHLVEVGLLERAHQVHLLPVAHDVIVQPLAAATDREQVRREATQPLGPGLAEEAASHQPGQLLAHVLQGRERGQLGTA